ncbi:MAG: CDP-alcohol phosphatidyltransferase family protein [Labilithrix sp.]|nr:CDP-alcohol phosphatidyltransferase family protein [Labilithrix sp.]MCW5818088.1 CDP-alcohol phosphatidyltransferase family protein [Labilithrix sp.]
MAWSCDLAASLCLLGALAVALGAHLLASLVHGRPLVASRVEREAGLPLVGRAPMHAVYRALEPLGSALAHLGVSANSITVASAVIALGAGAAFATGHFGVAAAIATVASLADGLDGFVARRTGTQSRFGQVLDTTVDRYVDAILLGGIALYVHGDVALLSLTIAAIVGSFMVSYSSSVERELGVVSKDAPMRRAHRLAFLLLASAVAPLTGDFALPVVFAAVIAIGVVGNVSAVSRLVRAARQADASMSDPVLSEPAHPATAPESERA